MSNYRATSTALAAIRVVIITVLATLLTFVVSLFLSVVAILLINMIRGGGINMAVAYRHIALPIAIAALVVAFVVALVYELRYTRRKRQGIGYRHAA